MDNLSYYFAILVPIVITMIFYLYKKHEFTWWEFFIPIAAVSIAIIISKVVIDKTSVSFTEYWGSTVIAVYEEEPYNYWHNETCSYTTSSTDSQGNTTTTTHYYDCSHQDDVAPSWHAVTNIGEKFGISEKTHDQLQRQFKTKKTSVETRRNHDASDMSVGSIGTKFEGKKVGNISHVYQTKWNGQDDTRKSYVSEHTYENRIKASDYTVFNISLVTEEEVDSLGLFRYPELKDKMFGRGENGLHYPTILSAEGVSPDIQEKFKRLNGKFGVSNELRLWILVFDDKPQSIARYQENYWVKGNMNELVICIGKYNNEIKWAHAFSWSLSNELTVDVRNKVLNLYQYKDTTVKKVIPPIFAQVNKVKNLPAKLPIQEKDSTYSIKSPNYPVLTNETWNELYTYLNKNLSKYRRRSFDEFSYLTVEPSTGAIIFIFILAVALSIGLNLWIINNEVRESPYFDKDRKDVFGRFLKKYRKH